MAQYKINPKDLARFQAFLKKEPVMAVLNRNRTFLLDSGKRIQSIEINDKMQSYTDGKKVVVSGLPSMITPEYDRRGWLIMMRVNLAHEIQHDNSSDFKLLKEIQKWFGEYMKKNHKIREEISAPIAQSVLNCVEDGRINEIVVQRFPGYLGMMRMVNFAIRGEDPLEKAAEDTGTELIDFQNQILSYAKTGLNLPGITVYHGKRLEQEFAKIRDFIDEGVASPTAQGCYEACVNLLKTSAPYIADLVRQTSNIMDAIEKLFKENYSQSSDSREEETGNQQSDSNEPTPGGGITIRIRMNKAPQAGGTQNGDSQGKSDEDGKNDEEKSSGDGRNRGTQPGKGAGEVTITVEVDGQNGGKKGSKSGKGGSQQGEEASSQEKKGTSGSKDGESPSQKGDGDSSQEGKDDSQQKEGNSSKGEDGKSGSQPGKGNSSSSQSGGKGSSKADDTGSSQEEGNAQGSQCGDGDGESSDSHGKSQRSPGDGENSQESASERAKRKEINDLDDVMGAGFSEEQSPPTTEEELVDMLDAAAEELRRATAQEAAQHVEPGKKTPLSREDLAYLKERYKKIPDLKEKFIVPTKQKISPLITTVAKRLHEKLATILMKRRAAASGFRRGYIAPSKLWQVGVGSDDIFQRKQPPKLSDCAVYELIDGSGSMSDYAYSQNGTAVNKLISALTTAAIMEEALKGLASTKITIFRAGWYSSVEHIVIKDFDQKPIGNRCYDSMTEVGPSSGNMDGFSIRIAAMDLAKRPEKTKILLVLSDGLPSAYSSDKDAIADVRSAVKWARAHGITVISIMFGEDNFLKSNYPSYKEMYEQDIIAVKPANITREFEKLLAKVIK